jgi:hypothetical protein
VLVTADMSALGRVSGHTINIYLKVCDNAYPAYGAQNCSPHTAASAINTLLPDVEPPPNFGGVTGLAASSPVTDGALTVTWQGPAANADWDDYKGFKVYDIPCKRDATPCLAPTNAQLVLLKDCACSAYGCTEHLTTCLVTALIPMLGITYSCGRMITLTI